MFYEKKTVIFWLMISCSVLGLGSSLPTLTLNTEGGLPQDHIYRIIQDTRGFLWFCTGEGVVKYDGERIEIYNLSHGYPFSLVNRILEVQPGVFWLADYLQGIWELKDGEVRKIEIAGLGFESHVTDIAIGPSGEVVVATNDTGGFYLIKGEQVTHWSHKQIPLLPDIYRVSIDDQGDIYLGSNSSGLMIFSKGTIESHYTKENVLPDNSVLCIHPYAVQNTWIGTVKGLAILGNRALSDRFNQQFESCPVHHVFRENENSYWISTVDGGGGLIHWDGSDFIPIKGIYEEGTTPRSDCVLIDRYGTMFIGSPTGLVTVPDRNFTNFGFKDGLEDTFIKGIAEDGDGRIWVGTKQSGLFYMEDKRFQRQDYEKDISHDSQILFVTSVGNQIWAGTMSGLVIIEGQKQVNNELTARLKGEMVRHVGRLKGGSLTITSQKKIFLLDEGELSDITYNFNDLNVSIWGVDQDKHMETIAATNRHGLWRLDDQHWVPIKPDDAKSNNTPPIIGMSKAPGGELLLPSRNGGFSWDGSKIEKCFERNTAVWDMIEGPSGVLWVATSEGLFKKTESDLIRYDRNMGLVNSEFNMQSSLIDSRGVHWFGGTKGLISYEEKKKELEPRLDNVFITEVSVRDETLHFPDTWKLFRYDQNDLTFRYSTPCYKYAGRVVYRYKLEGYDQDFKPGKRGNLVNYTNLHRGKYRFIVQSKLEYSEWPRYEAVFPFKIQMPWWLNPVAYLFYVLMGIGILFFIVKWRVRLLKVRNKALECLVENKLEALRFSHAQLEGEVKEKEAAESALEKEKENLAVTLKFIQDGVIKTNIDGTIEFINSVGLLLLGIEEPDALGRDFGDVIMLRDPQTEERITPPFASYLQELIQKPKERVKLLLQTQQGDVLINLTGSPVLGPQGEQIGMVYLIRDIELQQKFDEELFKIQKLDSIGLLAGGIAHDFNNILSGILGNAQLAILAEKKGKSCDRYLQGIEAATLSAKTLSQQLLTFSKGGEPVMTNLNLSRDLKNTVEFFLGGKQINANFDITADLWSIHADRGQIHQVLNNLIINACEAMPKRGTLQVSAHNLTLKAANRFHMKAGDYIKLSLADTGCGINKELLPKVFDPFFSTKSTGTGLGLATSYAIIEKHSGMITARSEQGKGATFDIYLPAVPTQQQDQEKPTPFKNISAKILFMDDDLAILEFIEEVFEYLGYDAVLTKDGLETVNAFKKAIELKQPFDLVIMDWTIPGGMGGEETIRQLLEIEPEVKALVSSGYSDQGALTKYREYGFVGILPKPYQIEELRKTIASFLNNELSPDFGNE